MKSILVTGGAGYIGSQTCQALAGAGYQPVVFDNLSTGHRQAVKWGPFVEGDVADRRSVCETLKNVRRIVFSSTCAACGLPQSIPISEQEPQKPVNPFVADNRRAQELLGWRSKYDNLNAIVSAAWRWHESHALTGRAVSGSGR